MRRDVVCRLAVLPRDVNDDGVVAGQVVPVVRALDGQGRGGVVRPGLDDLAVGPLAAVAPVDLGLVVGRRQVEVATGVVVHEPIDDVSEYGCWQSVAGVGRGCFATAVGVEWAEGVAVGRADMLQGWDDGIGSRWLG